MKTDISSYSQASPTISNPHESESKRFWRWSGYHDGTRQYGQGEKTGKVINFFYNRFFKNIDFGATKDPTASTREAFFISHNPKLPAGDRDKHVASRFQSEDGDFTSRTKKIKYGNHNAMMEILSSHLYRALGLEAPDSRAAVCEEYIEGKIPDVYVASPLISGYYDLGDFLVDEKIISAFLKEEDLPKWRDQVAIIKGINSKVNPESEETERQPLTAEDKLRKLKALAAIYKMMPGYVHREVQKSFIASKFIGNWDFANMNLNNIGVKFTFNSERKVVEFSSVFVDFGNSGTIGFKGRYKENSLDHANTEAKPYQEGSMDYDPALSFNEAEINLIRKKLKLLSEQNSQLQTPQTSLSEAISSLSKDLVQDSELTEPEKRTIRSIIYKSSHHIMAGESSFRLNNTNRVTTGLLSFSDLPRNLPFFLLFEDVLKEKTRNVTTLLDETVGKPSNCFDVENQEELEKYLEFAKSLSSTQISNDGKSFSPSLDIKSYAESELEMSFRLSLMTDEVIDRIIQDWYWYEDFSEVFKPSNSSDEPFSATELATIFKERRDFLATRIPHEVVTQWVNENPLKALAAQREVHLANLRENYQEDPDFETKYPFEGAKVGESSLSKEKITTGSQAQISRVIPETVFSSSESLANLVAENISLSSSSGEEPEIRLSRIRSENSIEERIKDKSRLKRIFAIDGIIREVEQYSVYLEKEQQDNLEVLAQERREAQENLSSADGIIAKSLTSMVKEKSEQMFEIRSEINCKLLGFIAQRIPEWTQILELEPDNNFLRLEQVQSMQSAHDRTDLSISAHDIVSKDANQKRNQIIDSRNQSTYEQFMGNLRSISMSIGLSKPQSIRLSETPTQFLSI